MQLLDRLREDIEKKGDLHCFSAWLGCCHIFDRPQALPACLYVQRAHILRKAKRRYMAGGKMDEQWHVESKMRTSGNTAGTWDSVSGTALVNA